MAKITEEQILIAQLATQLLIARNVVSRPNQGLSIPDIHQSVGDACKIINRSKEIIMGS